MSAPPLPILAISLDAYRILFRNYGVYLRLSWLPFLIIFATSTGMQFVYRDVLPLEDENNGLWRASAIFLEGCLWLLTIPVATMWTRRLLLKDDARVRLSLGRPEAVYLWRYVCLLVMGLGPFALVIALLVLIAVTTGFDPDIFYPEASGESIAIIGVAALIPVVTLSLLAVSRFILALPAAAVRHSSRLRDSFAHTKARMWALVAILMLTFLPEGLGSLMSIVWGSDAELGPNDGILSAAWITIQYYGASWLFFPVSVGALALAYRHLGGMADAAATPAFSA